MRITKHITFFYLEDRKCYVNRIIEETNIYELTTDIFIHTNYIYLKETDFTQYTNGVIKVIFHNLSNINPFYLTWKCRELLEKQRYDYDIFMYIEDDILVPSKAIKYWLEYNEKLIEYNCNLGFVRIEVDNNIEYITDLPAVKFDTVSTVSTIGTNDNTTYCINNKVSYCAFWIYNKSEFNKFVDSPYYDINNVMKATGCGIRESSAFGLHSFDIKWYKYTLIPLVNNKLTDACKIYHMPNNYVNNNKFGFATIKFDEALIN
jgi:hypothetical protein